MQVIADIQAFKKTVDRSGGALGWIDGDFSGADGCAPIDRGF